MAFTLLRFTGNRRGSSNWKRALYMLFAKLNYSQIVWPKPLFAAIQVLNLSMAKHFDTLHMTGSNGLSLRKILKHD